MRLASAMMKRAVPNGRPIDAKIDNLLETQFAAGRLYACISSRPGQSGRADGYILEGKELEVRRAPALVKDLALSMCLSSSTSGRSGPVSRSTPTQHKPVCVDLVLLCITLHSPLLGGRGTWTVVAHGLAPNRAWAKLAAMTSNDPPFPFRFYCMRLCPYPMFCRNACLRRSSCIIITPMKHQMK